MIQNRNESLAGGPVLQGHLVADRAGLASLLLAPQPWPPLVSDLHLGEWKPMQLAAELAAQLSLSLEDLPLPGGVAGDIDATAVGSWVELEGMGDLAIRRAYFAAGRVAAALGARPGARLFVVVPREPVFWTRDSAWLLHFLARGCTPDTLQLMAWGGSAPALPEGLQARWRIADPTVGISPEAAALLRPTPLPAPDAEPPERYRAAWVPGLLTAPFCHALGLQPKDAECALVLPSGVGVVDPEWRYAAEGSSGHAVGAFSDATGSSPWISDYVAFRDRSEGPGRLVQAAWRNFATGALDLARRYADEAHRRGRSEDTYLCLQTLNLVCQEYGAMAQVAAPEDVDDVRGKRLARYRAWGMTLSGEADAALAIFDRALEVEDPAEPSWLRLYMRNIRALALARAGCPAEALQEEREIHVALQDFAEPGALEYLNALNLSRLYRAEGDLPAASEWLDRAERATAGLGGMSDAVHFAALRARLSERQGEGRTARRHWLTAALAFSALEPPEALGWRVVASLLQGGQARDRTDADACAHRLCDALRIEEGGSEAVEALAILDPALHPPPAGPVVVAAEGWCLLTSPERLPPALDSCGRRRLAGGLRALLPGLPEDTRTAWLLRTACGRPLKSLDDAVAASLWHGAPRLVWEGVEVNLPALSDRTVQTIALGPGVASVTGGTVRFRRYRAARELSPTEQAALTLCGKRVEDIDPEWDAVLAELVSEGVLCLLTRIEAAAPLRKSHHA